MILSGVITDKLEDNKYTVGIDLFDGANIEKGTRVAYVCSLPYLDMDLRTGDPVYVLCLQGNPNNPIIIGTLPKSQELYNKMDFKLNTLETQTLSIGDKAELPFNTSISDLNIGTMLKGLSKMFPGLNEGKADDRPVILKESNYGMELPTEGENGQIFFLLED